MRRAAWALLPVAVVAGIGIGYGVRGQQWKTKVETVIQIQTVAPPPPATKTIAAYVAGTEGACLSTDTNHQSVPDDTFTLRDQGDGIHEARILAVADDQAMDEQGCDLLLHFSLSPDLGFFYVRDDTSGSTWGPFDSHKLKAYGYRLRLRFSS